MVAEGIHPCAVRRCTLATLFVLLMWAVVNGVPAYADPGVVDPPPQADPSPVIEAAAPVADTAAEIGAPVADKAPDAAAPAVDQAVAPAAHKDAQGPAPVTKHVVEATDPVVDTVAPVTKQVVGVTEPAVETPAPAAEVTEPNMETPAAASVPAGAGADPLLTTAATVPEPPTSPQAGPLPLGADGDGGAPAPPPLEPSPVEPVGGSVTQPSPPTTTAFVPPRITTSRPIAPGPIPVSADRPPVAHDGGLILLPGAAVSIPSVSDTVHAAARPPTAPATSHKARTRQAPPALSGPAPPGAVASGASASSGAVSSTVALAILFSFLLVPCLVYGRVVLAPARSRPMLFVSLLERPG
jgi:hypothetical protein